MQPQDPYQQPGRLPASANPYAQMPLVAPKKHFNVLIIPMILLLVLFIAAAAFGIWAFNERGIYKTDSDRLVAEAVAQSVKDIEEKKDLEFTEREKDPYKSYKGPAVYGTLTFNYPKTWSAYISDDQATSTTPVNGYFNPNYVPNADDAHFFALRIQVVASPYDVELKKYDNDVKQGAVKVAPFRLKNVPDVLGARLSGKLDFKKSGVMVILPLRDKTIKVWTESENFYNDFDKIILPEFTFVR